MGLDVYLSRFEDFESSKALELAYNARVDRIWADAGPYDAISEEKKEEIRSAIKKIQEELGCDDSGNGNGEEGIELPSTLYPEHMFKIGYFRSSYNDGGIERVVANLLNTNGFLYDVFRHNQDEYEFRPDWDAAKSRAEWFVAKLKELRKGMQLRALEITPHQLFREVPKVDGAQAIQFVQTHIANGLSGSFSNLDGEFILDEPLKVRGLVPGIGTFDRPTVWVVYEVDGESTDWYIQAAEIVLETIQWVLARDDKDKFYLHWSS